MIAYVRRPGTRRKPPAGTVPEPSAGPRATPKSLPRPRLVRLCPMKNHATGVTTPPACNPPFWRHVSAPQEKRAERLGQPFGA
jgi:hypothetical protein